ncbi:MAG: peptidoglycan-binding protein [Geitlerinemataceae cyanobacterium]
MSTLRIALNQIDPTLMAEGSRGRRVVRLQKVLRLAGCYTGFVDGVFGAQTRRAIEILQRYYGQPITGIFDPSLWHSLSLDACYPTELIEACRRHKRNAQQAQHV